jgi:hypothetical protein
MIQDKAYITEVSCIQNVGNLSHPYNRQCRPTGLGYHWTALRLCALCAGHILSPRAILQLEGLGNFKNPMPLSRIESAIFRLVAYCLNEVRYHVLQTCSYRTALGNFYWRSCMISALFKSLHHTHSTEVSFSINKKQNDSKFINHL